MIKTLGSMQISLIYRNVLRQRNPMMICVEDGEVILRNKSIKWYCVHV